MGRDRQPSVWVLLPYGTVADIHVAIQALTGEKAATDDDKARAKMVLRAVQGQLKRAYRVQSSYER
jgi:hypothetical protein